MRFEMIARSDPALWLAFVLACCLVPMGCEEENTASENNGRHHVAASAQPDSQEVSPTKAHDPEHPPIDCPLRKQGIDPARATSRSASPRRCREAGSSPPISNPR